MTQCNGPEQQRDGNRREFEFPDTGASRLRALSASSRAITSPVDRLPSGHRGALERPNSKFTPFAKAAADPTSYFSPKLDERRQGRIPDVRQNSSGENPDRRRGYYSNSRATLEKRESNLYSSNARSHKTLLSYDKRSTDGTKIENMFGCTKDWPGIAKPLGDAPAHSSQASASNGPTIAPSAGGALRFWNA
jgi:hypothetical protein